jgi:hypothetical protein
LLASDPENCGACGHRCLGGVCVDGLCQPVEIAGGFTSPGTLAVGAGYIYVRDRSSSGSIKAQDLSGEQPPLTLISGVGTGAGPTGRQRAFGRVRCGIAILAG